MRDKLKKLALVFMALCLLIMTAAPAQVKAADKVALNKTNLTMRVGDHAILWLNNVSRDEKVTWSSSNEAVVATVDWHGSLHAKKKGTAKITAQYKNKKYICTVKVKRFALSNTEGKNEKDVKALKAIVKKQNLKGAELPIDLDSDHYRWDDKGNLAEINWDYSELRGSLSLKEFESLEIFDCYGNDGLSSLDVSKNMALTELDCSRCSLSKLDVSKNTALIMLSCFGNQLSSLDVSKNTTLIYLDCGRNQLSSLDLSKNAVLTKLFCNDNQLSSLDVSKCTALSVLFCNDNQLSELDLSKNKAFFLLQCDGCVKVTGYSGYRE